MILLNGPNTPFGRMTLATAHELNLDVDNKIINVFEAEVLDAINPLRQIPTLLFDGGTMLCDSRVICSYFCSLRPGRGLSPVDDRWDVQTRWWLALGLMEASVGRVMELLRPEPQRSPAFIEKCDRRIRNVVAKLESFSEEICTPDARVDRLATAIALEYIDFRHLGEWRKDAPQLATWLERETLRPSLVASRPRERRPSDPSTFADH
ncbi:MAG: glutathione S-transferase family protein [Burkholderiales bacterium]